MKTKFNFLILFVAFFASVSIAKNKVSDRTVITVAEYSYDQYYAFANISFEVNKDNGHAWIEYDLYDQGNDYGEGASYNDHAKVVIDGLAFNKANSIVEFTGENFLTPAVCKKFISKGSGLFSRTVSKDTKKCSFETEKFEKINTTYFGDEKKTYIRLNLVILK